MGNDDNQDHEQQLRERIASAMRAASQAPQKPLSEKERQQLQSAASRLDQLLKASDDTDQQVLKSAAARLDQFLKDIRRGKDITNRIKRRDR
jgi:BMFP domain-containing protein YqiC